MRFKQALLTRSVQVVGIFSHAQKYQATFSTPANRQNNLRSRPDGHKFANAHKCRGTQLTRFGIRNSRNIAPPFDSWTQVKQFTCSGAQIETARLGLFLFVLPPGVEPGAPVPQTGVLSIKLREQVSGQAETNVSIWITSAAHERGVCHVQALTRASEWDDTLKSKKFQEYMNEWFLKFFFRKSLSKEVINVVHILFGDWKDEQRHEEAS